MVKVKLDNGFEAHVNDKRMRDVRFIKFLSQIDDEDLDSTFKIIDTVLGEEQAEKLYDFLAKDDGEGGTYTDIEDVTTAIQEIFDKLNIDGESTGKNS